MPSAKRRARALNAARRRAAARQNAAPGQAAGGERLQRIMAAAGVAARRACETMILEGRVSVNGRVVSSLPAFADPASDTIAVDGRVLPRAGAKRHVYIMLNKPARTLSTTADEEHLDRTTVLELVKHPANPRLFPVGRLDWEATGLMLLTDDGDLANRLTHPRYGVAKTYEAVVRGSVSDEALDALRVEIRRLERRAARRSAEGVPTDLAPPEIRLVSRVGDKAVLEVTLRESRNRQVREMLAAAGLSVKRITRTAIGPLRLRGVAIGRWRELERDELRALRRAAKGGESRGSAGRAAGRGARRSAT